jgi:putative oxidoreductase
VAAKVILLLLRLALGGVFIYAGSIKAFATQDFAHDIHRYDLVPWTDAVLLLAVYLPWLEIFSGLAVICRKLYLGGLAVLITLTLIFLGALTSAWTRGLDIECGCFGREKAAIRTHFPSLLMRDLALLAAGATLLLAERRNLSARLPKPAL